MYIDSGPPSYFSCIFKTDLRRLPLPPPATLLSSLLLLLSYLISHWRSIIIKTLITAPSPFTTSRSHLCFRFPSFFSPLSPSRTRQQVLLPLPPTYTLNWVISLHLCGCLSPSQPAPCSDCHDSFLTPEDLLEMQRSLLVTALFLLTNGFSWLLK